LELSGEQRIAIMDQKALAVQNSVHRIRGSATHFAHAQTIPARSDACNLHFTCRQVNEEEDQKASQSFTRPDFDGEEVRRPD
jgi:hypothetical protein